MGNSEAKISPRGDQGRQQGSGPKVLSRLSQPPVRREDVLKEEALHAMLTLERRRAQRSRKPFVLMLLDLRAVHKNGNGAAFLERLTSVVSDTTRETDIIGWYEENAILGVIFTEVNSEEKIPTTEVLRSKVATALRDGFGHKLASNLIVTVHVFPEDWDKNRVDREADSKLYPDVSERPSRKRFPLIIKRGIDIVGSSILLLLFSPIFASIAVAIKLTSKGPILFRQERLGQFGKRFECLKFRTMYADNDPKIHRDFVQSFIAGAVGKRNKNEAGAGIYKIKHDPRVTPFGRFLRKISLDELPQFWNVLRGEMSLVGPRPPVPYEFEVYDFWHRRRVLELKPGVTGLWQVSGRSRTCFDDMVRLDLRYSQRWSLWLDFKILLATPLAVFSGDGAY
jgi:lipopolysaccharide/colanic/teichoic acid biosynthesis glycosyltransferase